MKKIFWGIGAIIIIVFFVFTWQSTVNVDKAKGFVSFKWSGWSALFDDNDFGIKTDYYIPTEFESFDGPYIVGDKVYKVNAKNEFIAEKLTSTDSILVEVNNNDNDKFFFPLKVQHSVSNSTYEMPKKLIVISDIEGNFNAFSSFLINNKIIDENYDWIFEDGSLVLLGDFVDRGKSVTQVLWLIYKLEQQAESANGKVHFVLGNHEIINFQGRASYNASKYIAAARAISKEDDWDKAIKFMFSEKTELGKWLRTKNVVEKIGDYLFVHAGLNPEILNYQLSLNDINTITRENWNTNLIRNPGSNEVANFLLGVKSPIWYRGMAKKYKYYDKISNEQLDNVLSIYDAKSVVIGHSVVEDITKDFEGKIIKIDVHHGKEKNSELTKGILFENGEEFKIDGLGNKVKF